MQGSPLDKTHKKLENATTTLANFTRKCKSLDQRMATLKMDIARIQKETERKRQRNEVITLKDSTKVSTLRNNARYCERREALIQKKRGIRAGFEKRRDVLVDKIAKKKLVIAKLRARLDRRGISS
jgi:multidrug resistance efflux pump